MMADHDDLEDVELNYLRDQALSSRQQLVPPYLSYPPIHPSANSEVNLDLDIFNPSSSSNRKADKSRQRRPHRQTTPELTAEMMKSFDKKVSSIPRTTADINEHHRARSRSSSSSSRSSSTSSYSSYSRRSYSSSQSLSGSHSHSRSHSHSTSRSLSPSTKSTTSRSTYSSVSNHSHVRRRSRSPIHTYHRHHHQSGRHRSSVSPHRERSHNDRLSNPRRRHHSNVRTGRPVNQPVRYQEYSRRSPPSSSPHSVNRSKIRSPLRGFRAPPPPRRSVPHRRSSPPRRSPPLMSRRTPPPVSRRSPPRRPPPSHRSPLSYRDSRPRGREPPPRPLHPSLRSPHRRRHSLSPPRSTRRRRSFSPPPVMRRHSPPPPPRRRIRMSPPLKPLPPSSHHYSREQDSRRRVVVRDRSYADQWEGSSSRERGREPRYSPRDRDRGPRSDRDSRESRRLEQKESLEQWRKRKREEESARNEGGNPKKISKRVSSSEPDIKPSKIKERRSSGADGDNDDDDRRRMVSPSREESGISEGGVGVGGAEGGGGGIDILDEELDYDETMDDIELLYLRGEDDDAVLPESSTTAVLKSEVVPRHSPHSTSEPSPPPPRGDLESVSGDESEAHSDTRVEPRQDSSTDNAVIDNTVDNLEEIDDPAVETKEEAEVLADVEKQESADNMEDENEEGLLKDEEEEKEMSTEEGEVLPQSSSNEEDHEHVSDEDLGMEPTQPISSPIRLTPERGENQSGRSRHHPSQQSGREGGGGGDTRRRDEDKKERLPVRDRLYLSKSDIERKKESLSYRQHHKLSPTLASRLGPPSGRPRNSGQRGASSGGLKDRPRSSKRDAVAIAEAYRRQKRKNDLHMRHDDPEFQREKRRISKLLLNDQYDSEKGSSHRNPKNDDVDLDQKINKIRREDQRRLMRQEEVRKDRQRYG